MYREAEFSREFFWMEEAMSELDFFSFGPRAPLRHPRICDIIARLFHGEESE